MAIYGDKQSVKPGPAEHRDERDDQPSLMKTAMFGVKHLKDGQSTLTNSVSD